MGGKRPKAREGHQPSTFLVETDETTAWGHMYIAIFSTGCPEVTCACASEDTVILLLAIQNH